MARIKFYVSISDHARDPVDEEEEEASEMNDHCYGNCRVTIKNHWVCTREQGHSGDHVAGWDDLILARWKPCSRERRRG